MSFLYFWGRSERDGVPPQVDSNQNTPDSVPPRSHDVVQDDAKPEGKVVPDPPLPTSPDVTSASARDSPVEEHMHMELDSTQEDAMMREVDPSRLSKELPQPVSELEVAALKPNVEHQNTFTSRASALEAPSALSQEGTSLTSPLLPLQSRWAQFATLADSFTGNLISAGDRRRKIIRKRQVALQAIDERLNSKPDSVLQEFREILSELQASDLMLQVDDENLVVQGYAIITQGAKIFGPQAAATLQTLDQQGIVIESEGGATTESIYSTDDIRLDQTSEARRFLSKKGDVELLRETLMGLDREQTELPYSTEEAQQLESSRQEVLRELEQAEEDLEELHNRLPDRKANIPDDQLFPSGEQEDAASMQQVPGIGYAEKARQTTDPDVGDQKDHQLYTLSQILDSVTDNNGSVTSHTLVNAYLLYQLRRSSQEREAFLKIIGDETKNKQAPGAESSLPLQYWFDDEAKSRKSHRSRVTGTSRKFQRSRRPRYSRMARRFRRSLPSRSFSQPSSNAPNADTPEHGGLVDRRSEPTQRRQRAPYHTSDATRQLSMLAHNRAKDNISLR